MNELNKILPHVRLKFNIEHPTYEECYAFGYECAKADLDETENPYPATSKEAEEWAEGWWAGFYNEQPLFTLESAEEKQLSTEAANDKIYHSELGFFSKVLRITGALAASAVVGYQVLDLVA